MHDALDLRDLVPDEAEQLASAGYPVGDLQARARLAAAAGDLTQLAGIEAELAALHRDPDWPYEEPEPTLLTPATPGEATGARASASTGDAAGALAPSSTGDAAGAFQVVEAPSRAHSTPALADKIRGAWLGRCVGNTMGKPVEGLSRADVRSYLEAAGDWPLTGFVPYVATPPPGITLHPSAVDASAGRFTAVPRDDDLDWTMLGLHLLETYGRELHTEDVAREWLDRMPFTQTYTAERAAYRNLVHGLRSPDTATTRNPYREWIGALIRVDAYGYVSPGNPTEAARLALIDASLSHTANGLYGAQWAAALVAQALVADTITDALGTALTVIPPRSRLADSQRALLDLHEQGCSSDDALDWIDETLPYNWVHTINNAAIITTALLWGGGDYVRTLALCVGAGRDTDSNGATVGSVFGALHGAAAIPSELATAGNGVVRSAVRGFDRITIDELADRTIALIG
ncbi:ADP-ribosylglycohydrolase family protein [Kribbella sp. NPDC051770]|uniref:ADP-ribosylglycohydrolase family protein n=1 Tax=Kribbella sp. NPDC051770 TaxID=3155413 RepID=UPI003439F19D